jgi:hypothetical protein
MDSAGFTAAISGVVALVTATVSVALTYFFTKKREREADWRKMKLELYREFVAAVAGIAEGRMTTESEIRYHDAFNTIGLVASSHALAAVQNFQAEISPRNRERTQASHDEKYTFMINALRNDLMGGAAGENKKLKFYIISTRPWSGSITPELK